MTQVKIDAVVLRETRFVAVGTLFFAALEQLAFMAFRSWGLPVLLGTLLSGAAGVLNFFLLGLTVQRSLATGDPEQAKSMMKLSRTVRMLGQLAVLAVGVLLDAFSTVAVIVTIFFPRLVLVVRQLILARRGEGQAAMPAAEAENEVAEQGGDEAENEYE